MKSPRLISLSYPVRREVYPRAPSVFHGLFCCLQTLLLGNLRPHLSVSVAVCACACACVLLPFLALSLLVPVNCPHAPTSHSALLRSWLLFGVAAVRIWKGTAFGGWKSRSQVPGLVDDYLAGKVTKMCFHHGYKMCFLIMATKCVFIR